MIHVEDLPASVRFYEALGARMLRGNEDGDFALLDLGGAQLSLLAHPPNPEQDEGVVELDFETDDLDAVHDELREVGVEIVSPPTTQGFGRQLQARAPGGLVVKINQFGPELRGDDG
jgi:catechol 2,3-dioxygenase-like lactoylglutathione lyase family enzyme